jgi:uncharacterized membrane protein
MAYFCSPRLKGTQVVGGGNWTFNVADAQANLNANFAVNDASIYVWRPSTGTVVGYLKQAGSSGGALPATVAAQEQVSINTFSTTGITAQDGDVIIFEAWALFTQVMATAYTGTIYFDGPVRNTTENAAVTNHAAFITMSEDLNFYFTKHKKTIRIPVNFGAVADLPKYSDCHCTFRWQKNTFIVPLYVCRSVFVPRKFFSSSRMPKRNAAFRFLGTV